MMKFSCFRCLCSTRDCEQPVDEESQYSESLFQGEFFFFDLLLFTFLKFQPLGWIQIHVDQMCGYRDNMLNRERKRIVVTLKAEAGKISADVLKVTLFLLSDINETDVLLYLDSRTKQRE